MRYLLLLCISIFLIGCDHFPGPSVRNEFSTQARITISYSDGKTISHDWPRCQVLRLGAMDVGKWGVKPKKGVAINEVIVEAEDKVIHRFDKQAIDAFIDKTKREQQIYSIWIIDSSGMRFSAETEDECKKAL